MNADPTLFDDQLLPSIYVHGDEPRARRCDPLTSHEAADATVSTKKQSQDLVHEQLRRSGPQAAYQVEYALRFKGVSGSRVRTALNELEKLGRAERLPHRIKNPRGLNVQVWKAR